MRCPTGKRCQHTLLISPKQCQAKLEYPVFLSSNKEASAMKKTRYTEEQIAFALKQAETGTRVGEVCRKMGISEATFYNWKKKFAGLGVTELRRLRQLEDENQRLKNWSPI
jgi:putative transposase